MSALSALTSFTSRSSELFGAAEVIDLTHEDNVALFRKWDQKEVAYIDLLRFIRIFSGEPDRFVVSRPGKHVTLISSNKDEVMDVEQS